MTFGPVGTDADAGVRGGDRLSRLTRAQQRERQVRPERREHDRIRLLLLLLLPEGHGERATVAPDRGAPVTSGDVPVALRLERVAQRGRARRRRRLPCHHLRRSFQLGCLGVSARVRVDLDGLPVLQSLRQAALIALRRTGARVEEADIILATIVALV